MRTDSPWAALKAQEPTERIIGLGMAAEFMIADAFLIITLFRKRDLRLPALVEWPIEWHNATLFHAMATLSIHRAHEPPSGPDTSPARPNEAEMTQQFQVVK